MTSELTFLTSEGLKSYYLKKKNVHVLNEAQAEKKFYAFNAVF